MDSIDCIYSLESLQQARFQARFQQELRETVGAHGFGAATLAKLRQLELDDESYGSQLFDSLFPPQSSLRAAYRQEEQRAKEHQWGLRLRLHLSPVLLDPLDEIQDLAWERIFDPERQIALARSPSISFSRYPGSMAPLALPGRPRLLGVVAAPPGLKQQSLTPIHRQQVTRWLVDCFQTTLGDRADSEFLEAFVTPQALRDRLQEPFQALHLIAHGMPAALHGSASLLLQDAEGLGIWIGEEVVADIFLDCPELRLILLMSCFGAAAEGQGPFQGLAGRLVQRGLPAVIAMRRQISIQAAERFTAAFYEALAETGQVDVAVNSARMELFLDPETQGHWSDPVLFMALPDGRPWLEPATPAGPEQPAIPMPAGPAPSRHPWSRSLLLAAAVLVALAVLLALRLPNRTTDARGEPTTYLPLQGSHQQGPSTSPPTVPAARQSPPAPAPSPEQKAAARPEPSPVEAPSPPAGPDLDGLRARIRDAESYAVAGGAGNLEKSLRIYRKIAGDLSPVLDPGLLRLAQEQDHQGHTTDAIRLYRQLLNAYLQAFSSSTRRIDP